MKIKENNQKQKKSRLKHGAKGAGRTKSRAQTRVIARTRVGDEIKIPSRTKSKTRVRTGIRAKIKETINQKNEQLISVRIFLIGEFLILILNVLCYGDLCWILPEQILLIPCFKILRKREARKQQKLYERGFQDLLQSLMTSLQAGYSLENAFKIAAKELEGLYQNEKNPMLRQTRRIVQGLELHIVPERLITDFADSTGLEEARQFAVVIEIVRSTGGNMVEILKRTMQHLKYKMDTEEEIRVLLSGKLFEKNIMLSMPFLVLTYLRLANPEYVACFYESFLGHLIMSAMIGITIFCFFWSEKIMNIRF